VSGQQHAPENKK